MVMGQLFMKLAPTVTTMLGAKTPRTEGNLLAALRAEAKRLVIPAALKPCTTMKMHKHKEHDVPVDVSGLTLQDPSLPHSLSHYALK